MRILLVEDDHSLGKTIQDWLVLDGYVVDWVKRGNLAKSALITHEYSCALLDRDVPEVTGDALLASIRQHNSKTAAIMITAKDSIADRVQGLDLGADDYLVKPFDLAELSARIRAAIRKYNQTNSNLLTHHKLQLNPIAKTVHYDGKLINLTAKEYVVLYRLMRHPNHIISKEQLTDELYGWGEEIESNAVEVYISNIRKKTDSHLISTIRRQGYTLSNSSD